MKVAGIRPGVLLAAVGGASVIIAAPAGSDHVRDVLLTKMSAYEPKSGNLYHVANGAIHVGTHVLEFTPVVETDTTAHGKSIFAMRLEITVDGSAQPAATFGAIGIADNKEEAIATGLGEWYIGFGTPYFQALADEMSAMTIEGHEVFPGAMGLRGGSPVGWMNDSEAMHRRLLAVALPIVRPSADVTVLDLKISVPAHGFANSECRVNGVVAPRLSAALAALDWPLGTDAYIFKQAYVLKRYGAGPTNSR